MDLVQWSPEDLAVIRSLVYKERTRVKNTTGRGAVPEYGDPEATTEVYIAKTYAGGIPALTETPGNADDIPGNAECEIYRVSMESGTPRLRPVGVARTVYNLSLRDIVEEDTPWIAIKREKFGSWLADGGVAVTGGVGSEPDCGYLILDCPGTGTEGETPVGTGTEGDFVYLLLCCDIFDTCMPADTPVPASLTATVVIRDGSGGPILASFSMPVNYSDSVDYGGFTRAGWYGCSVRDVDTECVPVATVFLQCQSSYFSLTFNGFVIGGHTPCDGYVSTVGETHTQNLAYAPSPFAIDNFEKSFTGVYDSPTCPGMYVEVHISE